MSLDQKGFMAEVDRIIFDARRSGRSPAEALNAYGLLLTEAQRTLIRAQAVAEIQQMFSYITIDQIRQAAGMTKMVTLMDMKYAINVILLDMEELPK